MSWRLDQKSSTGSSCRAAAKVPVPAGPIKRRLSAAGRNFEDIFELLQAGIRLEPTSLENGRVVQRGLDKKAPFIVRGTASRTHS